MTGCLILSTLFSLSFLLSVWIFWIWPKWSSLFQSQSCLGSFKSDTHQFFIQGKPKVNFSLINFEFSFIFCSSFLCSKVFAFCKENITSSAQKDLDKERGRKEKKWAHIFALPLHFSAHKNVAFSSSRAAVAKKGHFFTSPVASLERKKKESTQGRKWERKILKIRP